MPAKRALAKRKTKKEEKLLDDSGEVRGASPGCEGNTADGWEELLLAVNIKGKYLLSRGEMELYKRIDDENSDNSEADEKAYKARCAAVPRGCLYRMPAPVLPPAKKKIKSANRNEEPEQTEEGNESKKATKATKRPKKAIGRATSSDKKAAIATSSDDTGADADDSDDKEGMPCVFRILTNRVIIPLASHFTIKKGDNTVLMKAQKSEMALVEGLIRDVTKVPHTTQKHRQISVHWAL